MEGWLKGKAGGIGAGVSSRGARLSIGFCKPHPRLKGWNGSLTPIFPDLVRILSFQDGDIRYIYRCHVPEFINAAFSAAW